MLSLESDDASQYAHSVKRARYRGLDAGGHVEASVVVSSIFALFGLSCGMAARRSKHFQRRVLSRPSSAGRDSRLAVFSSLGIVARTMLGLAREGILSACATAGGNQNFDHGLIHSSRKNQEGIDAIIALMAVSFSHCSASRRCSR